MGNAYAVQKLVTKLSCTSAGQRMIRKSGQALMTTVAPVAAEVGGLALGAAVVAAPYLAAGGICVAVWKGLKWIRS